MISVTIVPDSSFYICFLDDVEQPKCLLRLLNARIFKFVTGPLIKAEVEKSNNYQVIEKDIGTCVEIFEYYNYGEILRSFFSLEEIKRGDHEIIVISYVLYFLETEFMTILDDEKPKNFFEKKFSAAFGKSYWYNRIY